MVVEVSVGELTEELETFGIEADDAVLGELRRICAAFQSNAEDIITKWVAFSHSSGNIPLTVARLSDFQFYLTNTAAKAKSASSSNNTSSTDNQFTRSILADTQPDDYILNCYSENPAEIPQTPKQPIKKPSVLTPKSPFTQTSFADKLQQKSEKYTAKSASGSIVKEIGSLFASENDAIAKIRCENVSFECSKNEFPKFLSTEPATQQGQLYNALQNLGEAMQDRHNLDLTQLNFTTSVDVIGLGRVVCDGNGKLNNKSALLQTSAGDYLPLDLEHCANYAIFPGQMVALKGSNPNGNRVFVSEIYPGVKPPSVKIDTSQTGVVSIVSASGPFIPTDVFSLEPLQDFLGNVKKARPNVLIMTGPFVDCRNEKLMNIDEPLVSLFESIIRIISNLTDELQMNTIIIPSPRDAFHIAAYPIRPFAVTKFDISKGLHFLPDPCLFSINDIVIGVSSTDVVFHMSFEECSRTSKGPDRITRLVTHLLNQRSFYPLYPTHSDVNMDLDLLNFFRMPVTPHVLLLPSELSPYIKTAETCLAVNPGFVMKGQVGGTFSLLQIDIEKCNGKDSIPENAVSCKIVKV